MAREMAFENGRPVSDPDSEEEPEEEIENNG